MALGYQPIPFVLKEDPVVCSGKTVVITESYRGRLYYKYIRVPLDYVLKPGERLVAPPPKTM